MKQMRKQFIKLLNIHAPSGQEKPVREYLQPILIKAMDTVTIDAYGNLLASKKIGSGKGATVLLSAHMDTVSNMFEDRVLYENNGIITSSKGALGADDRGGIAIILEVLRNIEKLSFEGTLKIAFSREEEIGCVGSKKINPDWYSDVDLAIVVDRKGSRDIVTGCMNAFCSDEVGNFLEEVSAMQNMDWKACEGGISDAVTFSDEGINSVNLSAGYYNEHTDREYAVLSEMKDTVALILQAFAVINDFYHTFGDVPENNKWVEAYNTYKGTTGTGHRYFSYNETEYDEMVYAEEFDINGDVFVYEVGRDVAIQQGENEIILSRASLRSLFKQLKGQLND